MSIFHLCFTVLFLWRIPYNILGRFRTEVPFCASGLNYNSQHLRSVFWFIWFHAINKCHWIAKRTELNKKAEVRVFKTICENKLFANCSRIKTRTAWIAYSTSLKLNSIIIYLFVALSLIFLLIFQVIGYNDSPHECQA